MKTKHLIFGFLTTILLASSVYAESEKSDTYYLYLDQAKSFEGNDLGNMMDIIRKRLFLLGTDATCPNFSKGTGKSFATVEEFTDAFTGLMGSIPSSCFTSIQDNGKKYSTPFYGHGKILEWFRDINYSIATQPEISISEEEPQPKENTETQVIEEAKKEEVTEVVTKPEIIETEVIQKEAESVKKDEKLEQNIQTSETQGSTTSETNTDTTNEHVGETNTSGATAAGDSNENKPSPSESEASNNTQNHGGNIGNVADLAEKIQQVDSQSNTEVKSVNLSEDLQKKITEETGITIANGWQDSDEDGVSDAVEALSGTDLKKDDNDAERILDGTVSAKTPTIVNYAKKSKTYDSTPLIKGVVETGGTARFYYINENGEKVIVGEFMGDEGNKFIGELNELADGDYVIQGEAIDSSGAVKEIPAIEVSIKKSAEKQIKVDTIVKNDAQNNVLKKPRLKGYAKPGSLVEAYWQSLILSSAVIADADTGYFEVAPSKELDEGNHKVWIYSTDPETGAKTENKKIDFELHKDVAAAVLTQSTKNDKTAVTLGVAVIALLTGAGFFYIKKKANQ